MDNNYTMGIDGDDELNKFDNISKSGHVDVRIQTTSYMMYKIGKSTFNGQSEYLRPFKVML